MKDRRDPEPVFRIRIAEESPGSAGKDGSQPELPAIAAGKESVTENRLPGVGCNFRPCRVTVKR